MGRRLVWASSRSVAVVLMAPVIASAAILWTEVIFLVIPIEPLWVASDPERKAGVNHTSAA
jgi:hypothetical protein